MRDAGCQDSRHGFIDRWRREPLLSTPIMNSEPIFLRACRRLPVARVPVWFMRQAGRYMPEYRELRARHSILELCRSPELATRVTLMPVERFGFDAAIIFADLLLPLEGLGVGFHFAKGEGPVIERPVRDRSDIDRLRLFDPAETLGYVMAAIRSVRAGLPGHVPLIGFAGAPFTLASYMIEGGGSRHYVHVKSLMYNDPEGWTRLMRVVREMTRDYLAAQIEAGAQAVQLFDSWVGCLSPADYRDYVLPHSRWILDELAGSGAPTIHFGTGTATLLEAMTEAGGDVIGVDWRIPIAEARSRIGPGFAVQGNLDPALLFAPRQRLLRRVREILREAGRHPGYIFNLGHGVLPGTPVENVAAVVETVHAHPIDATASPGEDVSG